MQHNAGHFDLQVVTVIMQHNAGHFDLQVVTVIMQHLSRLINGDLCYCRVQRVKDCN